MMGNRYPSSLVVTPIYNSSYSGAFLLMPSSKQAPPPKAAAELPHNGFSLISNQKLIALYTAMLRCRLIEHHSRELIKSNLPSRFFASSLGREASAVGVAIDLRRSDRIAPAHWIHSALSSIRPTVPVIEELEGALRFALLQNQKESGALVVAFSMEPFTESDEWQHALQRASDQKLPILFVAPAAKPAPAKSRAASRTKPTYTFPTIVVDGNDVVAVYRVSSEAIFHARKGHGATLIECVHTPGSDPLRTMENYLRAKSLYTPALRRDLTAALRAKLHLDA
jgi:TPP-dependent pyruvate/acetoin dehydrogenase alpha subunit